MKWLLLLLLLLLPIVAEAQVVNQYVRSSTDSGYVTTTWKRFSSPGTYDKVVYIEVDHDTTGYARTPLLYVAFENDTTAGRLYFLRPGESREFPGTGTGMAITHFHIRASTGAVPYRVVWY